MSAEQERGTAGRMSAPANEAAGKLNTGRVRLDGESLSLREDPVNSRDGKKAGFVPAEV